MSCVSKASSAAEALRTPLGWLAVSAVGLLAGLALFPSAGDWHLAIVGAAMVLAVGSVLGLLAKLGARARMLDRNLQIEAALGADRRARLVFDRDGREILRNALAEGSVRPLRGPLRALAGQGVRRRAGRRGIAASESGGPARRIAFGGNLAAGLTGGPRLAGAGRASPAGRRHFVDGRRMNFGAPRHRRDPAPRP